MNSNVRIFTWSKYKISNRLRKCIVNHIFCNLDKTDSYYFFLYTVLIKNQYSTDKMLIYFKIQAKTVWC